MKQEFNIAFQIDKMTIFNVTYYTLGSNSSAHFSTNASKFVRNKRDFVVKNCLLHSIRRRHR